MFVVAIFLNLAVIADDWVWAGNHPINSPLSQFSAVDTRHYGVPYPGIFLVDAKGVIKAKFAGESYRDRPLFEDLLVAVDELTGASSP